MVDSVASRKLVNEGRFSLIVGPELLGSSAYLTIAGTTTAAPIYSDPDFLEASVNPILADSSGKLGPVFFDVEVDVLVTDRFGTPAIRYTAPPAD